jgi:hypothetical protein
MGLPRPPGSPITLRTTGCRLTLPAPMALRRCAGPDEVVRTHPFASDARAQPGKTPLRTALSPRYLIRMRSQVQVLAGPPAIPAGHSVVGSEPAAPAASLGRAGAARPSPAGTPTGPSGPLHPGRQDHDHHIPWPPTQPRTAATSRCSPLRAHSAAASDGAPHAGPACLVAQRSSAAVAARPHPGPRRQRPPLTNARPRQRRPRPDGRGGQQPAGRVGTRRPDTGRAGHRTRWTPDALDTGRAGRWTPDGRTPDGWTAGSGRQNRWVDTTWWTWTGDNARPLGAGWTLRRAAAVWATTRPGPGSSKDHEDGPGHRRDGRLQVPRRRPAGASAHCCPQTIAGRE